MSNDWKSKTHIKWFDSVESFVADLPASSHRGGTSWEGRESYEQSKRLTAAGWPDVVPEAESLITEIEHSGLMTRGRPRMALDMVGFVPCVPAYIAGAPESMFATDTSTQLSDISPMTLYVDACGSGAISAEKLKARGVALMALVLALSERRPVDLVIYAGMGNRGNGSAVFPVIRIESRPLDVSAAAYALSSAGFLRNLCFTYADRQGWSGAWAWGKQPTEETYQARVRELLGVTDQDLVLYGAHSTDPHIADPKTWLKKQLALHNPEAQAA